MTERSDVERAALLRELYTGAVADILDDLGPREQCPPADIRPYCLRWATSTAS